MKKVNQISSIKEFFESDEKTIIINYVNENIETFYLYIIKYFADQKDIKINFNKNMDELALENDLFKIKTIQVFNINDSKKLNTVINYKNKKIIFTDYKNYKKLNLNYNSINGYKFDNDIIFFIRNVLKINNDELLIFCKENPFLIFSEISKYLINDGEYSADQKLFEIEKNHILNIRKLIFDVKKSNFNIKNLYFNIKMEAKYKKFNFLTY